MAPPQAPRSGPPASAIAVPVGSAPGSPVGSGSVIGSDASVPHRLRSGRHGADEGSVGRWSQAGVLVELGVQLVQHLLSRPAVGECRAIGRCDTPKQDTATIVHLHLTVLAEERDGPHRESPNLRPWEVACSQGIPDPHSIALDDDSREAEPNAQHHQEEGDCRTDDSSGPVGFHNGGDREESQHRHDHEYEVGTFASVGALPGHVGFLPYRGSLSLPIIRPSKWRPPKAPDPDSATAAPVGSATPDPDPAAPVGSGSDLGSPVGRGSGSPVGSGAELDPGLGGLVGSRSQARCRFRSRDYA